MSSHATASCAGYVEAGDRARQEIERNLHDGAQGRLVAVALVLQRLTTHPELSDEARRQLNSVLTELRAGLAELRHLAQGLHPAILTDRGLEQALASLAHHAPLPVKLRIALPGPPLAMTVEAASYFTVAEGLTNIAKYAAATRAWIDVKQLEDHLVVEVGDNGAGGASVRPDRGLQGLRDRIAALSGTLTIDSPPGAGTVIRARLPI